MNEVGVIVGVVGGIFALLAMALIGWALCKQRRLMIKEREASNGDPTSTLPTSTQQQSVMAMVTVTGGRAPPPHCGGINQHGRLPFRQEHPRFGIRGMRQHFDAIRY